MSELAADFETGRPGLTVRISFVSSGLAAAQVDQGAPADVIVTADRQALRSLVEQGAVGGLRTIASARMAILVANGNPRGIEGIEDLARPDLRVVLCDPSAPCGRLAARVLAAAGVTVQPRSAEANVDAAAAKVVAGEADASVVYVPTVIALGDAATGLDLDDSLNVSTEYPAAVVSGSARSGLADDFVHFLTGPRARQVLSRWGFQTP